MASAVASPRTGLDLRIRRTVLGATQTELAAVLGVSRQRIGHLEAMLRPPTQSVFRYLGALDQVALRHANTAARVGDE
jgi:transcriptional regulator with XRE-family HTH domain